MYALLSSEPGDDGDSLDSSLPLFCHLPPDRHKTMSNGDSPDSTSTPTPAPIPAPRPKGIYCPSCHGVRLTVTKTRRVCPGTTVRYRRCVECGTNVATEEKFRKPRKSKKPKNGG